MIDREQVLQRIADWFGVEEVFRVSGTTLFNTLDSTTYSFPDEEALDRYLVAYLHGAQNMAYIFQEDLRNGKYFEWIPE